MLLADPEIPGEGACIDITWYSKKRDIVVEKIDIYLSLIHI